MGIRLDNALTMKLAGMGSGNTHHIDEGDDPAQIVRLDFASMIGEVARDVKISLVPSRGFKVNALFGIPPSLVETGPDDTVSLELGSAFLAGDSGEILFSLGSKGFEGTEEPSVLAWLSYTDATSGKPVRETVTIPATTSETPANLEVAESRVDEFLTLDKTLSDYHNSGDAVSASRSIEQLGRRLSSAPSHLLDRERAMVSDLAASARRLQLADGKVSDNIASLGIVGRWRIASQKGLRDLAPGDMV